LGTEIKNRRLAHRAQVAQPVRIRPFDSRYPEEVCTTVNVSRGGFYFTSTEAHYFAGMEVRVIRNFQPGDPTNREEMGDIVRVDRLNDGNWGIAVRVLLGRKTAIQTDP
jgi:hypothetical protein